MTFNINDLIDKPLPFYGVHADWTWFRLGDYTIECQIPVGWFKDPRSGSVIKTVLARAHPRDPAYLNDRFVDQPIVHLKLHQHRYDGSLVLSHNNSHVWLSVEMDHGFVFDPPPGIKEILEISDRTARNIAHAAYLREQEALRSCA